MTNQIFISYRHDDAGGVAGRLFDRLSSHFGVSYVFIDINSIPVGASDFRSVVRDHIKQSGVVLVIVGKQWLGQKDNGRRIDEGDDPVRVEVECALAEGVTVIPVYSDRKEALVASELPRSLEPLVWINGVFIETGRNFDHQERDLRRRIESSLWPTKLSLTLNRIACWSRRNTRWIAMLGSFLLLLVLTRQWAAVRAMAKPDLPAVLNRFDRQIFSDVSAEEQELARVYPDRASLISNTSISTAISETQATFDLFAFSAQAFYTNPEAIRTALARGARVRVVLVDPNESNMRNVESYFTVCGVGGNGPDWQIRSTRAGIDVFKSLAQDAPRLGGGSVEIKTWPYHYLNSFWVRDGRLATGIAHVEISTYGRGDMNPSVRCGSLAAGSRSVWQAQFDYIWEMSNLVK